MTLEIPMRYDTVAWLTLTTALASSAATLYFLWTPPSAPSQAEILDPVVLVGEIQALARLETASVPVQTTIQGARGEGWIQQVAGESLVFQGVGEVRAGVDLGRIADEDIWTDGQGTVWVQLPEAEIFGVELDLERSRVLSRDRGWFGRANAQFESEARRAAHLQLESQALSLGLQEAAESHAREVVSELLHALGAREVAFVGDLQSEDVPRPGVAPLG